MSIIIFINVSLIGLVNLSMDKNIIIITINQLKPVLSLCEALEAFKKFKSQVLNYKIILDLTDTFNCNEIVLFRSILFF